MQRETHRDDELPKRERETEERKRRQDQVQHHEWFLKGAPPDCKRLLPGDGQEEMKASMVTMNGED
jgi:hypothetical protein